MKMSPAPQTAQGNRMSTELLERPALHASIDDIAEKVYAGERLSTKMVCA
jgi:hypothetical protein